MDTWWPLGLLKARGTLWVISALFPPGTGGHRPCQRSAPGAESGKRFTAPLRAAGGAQECLPATSAQLWAACQQPSAVCSCPDAALALLEQRGGKGRRRGRDLRSWTASAGGEVPGGAGTCRPAAPGDLMQLSPPLSAQEFPEQALQNQMVLGGGRVCSEDGQA